MGYSYSGDGEYFTGDYATKEEAIAEASEIHSRFFVGKNRPPKPLSTGIFVDSIIEDAMNTLEDEWCAEWATFAPTDEQKKTLQEEIEIVMDRWFDQYKLHPKWFVVDDVEQFPST